MCVNQSIYAFAANQSRELAFFLHGLYFIIVDDMICNSQQIHFSRVLVGCTISTFLFCSAPIMTVTAAVVTNPAPRARSHLIPQARAISSIRARWISHLTELCNSPVLRLTWDHAHKRKTCVRTHKSQRNEHNKAPMIDKCRIINGSITKAA